MDTIAKRLRNIVREDGLLYTSDVVSEGIRKESLRDLLDAGFIDKEARGIYSFPDSIVDDLALLQSRGRKAVYSHATALFLHGMSDRVPGTITMTIPQGYNVSRLQKDYDHVLFHRVKPNLWNLGIVEGTTPQGNTVRLYDKERTVCDIVRFKKNMDPQVLIQGLKEYFSQTDKNTLRLMEYAQAFNVEDAVQDYMEVLSS